MATPEHLYGAIERKEMNEQICHAQVPPLLRFLSKPTIISL